MKFLTATAIYCRDTSGRYSISLANVQLFSTYARENAYFATQKARCYEITWKFYVASYWNYVKKFVKLRLFSLELSIAG